MAQANIIEYIRESDGIITLRINDPGQRANTMNAAYRDSMASTVDRLDAEKDTITGVILTSAKSTFFAGGDLRELISVTKDQAGEFFSMVQTMKSHLRRLETLGKPVVAALNGTALGGGLEIALACHHRIALDDPKAQFGLPEVTLGLLPGAGGIARTVRMLGLTDALLKVLLQGTRYSAAGAREIGLIDELANTPDELIAKARNWILAHPQSGQPWDQSGYRIPGGTPSTPSLAANLPAFPANLRKQLKGAPMPAPHHIMAAAVEGAQVDVDTALRIEGRYCTDLVCGQVAKNMVQAFWFDLNSITAGGSRPNGFAPRPAHRVAVVGAGMMGAGIAYVAARNGIDVVLKDVSLEAAEKGKAYSRSLLDKSVSRGRISEAKRDEVLDRIAATDDYAALADCDLVIEAVFENSDLKHQVFAEIEEIVGADALLASNTSTLPITELATGVQRRADFIGLHFFSPVDKMPLLEIVRGEQTSDAAVARALDFAAQIKKSPIVVNDSRGFFTSRVIGYFVNEALAMLGEGIHPNTIEQAALQAGYPVGPLQLSDELNLELLVKIRCEYREAAQRSGTAYASHPADAVVDRMVELGRTGRSRGRGFYEYSPDGKRASLWSGLADEFGSASSRPNGLDVDLHELQERMLFAEAVDSARCFEEGVLTTTADGNIGSIMGIGFPPWTGGVFQYIAGYPGGIEAFVARADELAARYGDRFSPGPLLRKDDPFAR